MEKWGGDAALDVFAEVAGDVLDDAVRLRAVSCAAKAASFFGADAVAGVLVERLLPFETSDAVLVRMAAVLGAPVFDTSRAARAILNWLLEHPVRPVRAAAVVGTVARAQRTRVAPVYSRADARQLGLLALDGLEDASSNSENGANSIAVLASQDANEKAEEERPLIMALSDASGTFQTYFQRISVCELLARDIVPGLTREELDAIVIALGRDQVPSVRAALAEHVGRLARRVRKDKRADMNVPLIPLNVLHDLTRDPDDHVQAITIEICLGEFVDELRTMRDFSNFIMSLREAMVHSPSWRTRLAVAKQLDMIITRLREISGMLNSQGNGSVLQAQGDIEMGEDGLEAPSVLPLTMKPFAMGPGAPIPVSPKLTNFDEVEAAVLELFTDPEAEVRTAAAVHLEVFFPSPSATQILEILLEDEEPAVRRAILSQFAALMLKFGSYIPTLLKNVIVSDPDCEVRTYAVHVLFTETLLKAVENEQRLDLLAATYASMIPAQGGIGEKLEKEMDVSEEETEEGALAAPTHSWRIKMEVLESLPIAIRFVSASEWTDVLHGIEFLSSCLRDSVYSLRKKACEQVGPLVDSFGVDWAKANLVSLPRSLLDEATVNYKQRLTVIDLVESLKSKGISFTSCDEILKELESDPVKNVREKTRGFILHLANR